MSSLSIHRIKKIKFKELHLLPKSNTWSLTLNIYQENNYLFDINLFSKNKEILENLLNSKSMTDVDIVQAERLALRSIEKMKIIIKKRINIILNQNNFFRLSRTTYLMKSE